MPRILSLDEGTTSARAVLYDETGAALAMESSPLPTRYPKPGWVEQDAEDIWIAQWSAVEAVLKRGGPAVDAIGITNQRETTIVWDRKTGEPVAPAVVWQCRRTSSFCEELARSSDGPGITSKTGLVIDAYFSASKIRWILDQVGTRRDLCFGTVDTWLIWKLTGGAEHVTDVSNASRTMLMNLQTGDWDDDLLRIFGVPRDMLPRIVSSSEQVGVAKALGGAPICGIAGDQQAALAGQACFRPGLSKNTYGTGCFALLHTGSHLPVSKNKLVATRAASRPGETSFAVEGSTFIAGAAIQWLRDKVGVLRTAVESEEIAESVPDNGGVYLVPAFVGLGAPYWDAGARGVLAGITAGTSRAHIVRAALESIAFQTCELVQAMEADSGETLKELRVDGGASVNNFLMQFQADVLGKPIVRPVDVETTALGAAYLAGLAAGIWTSTEQVESFWRAERRFEPRMEPAERQRLMGEWCEAVSRSRSR